MKKNKRVLLSIILSCLTVNIFKIGIINQLIILLLFSIFYNYILNTIKIDKRKFFISITLSFLYTIFSIIGIYLTNKNILFFDFIQIFISKIIMYTSIIIFLFSKIGYKKSNLQNIKYLKTKVIIFLIICYIPVFLASYPGVFNYDAPGQVYHFLIAKKITNYQPVLSSAFMSYIINFGKTVFQSWEAGVAVLTIIQMLICFYIIAYLIEYLQKRNVPRIILLTTILFFGLFPINHLLIVNVAKDTLFSFFFLLLMITITEMFENPDEFFKSNKKIIQLILICLLTLLYRNNAIYVWIVTITIYIFVFKKYLKQMLIILIATVLPYFLITHPLYNLLGIESNNFREMLSIPAQSIVYTYNNNTKNISKKDKKIMKKYFVVNNLSELNNLYMPHNADNTKFAINEEELTKNKKEFLNLFISLSIKYPIHFTKAFINNIIGYIDPEFNYTKERYGKQSYIEYKNKGPINGFVVKRNNFIPILSNYYLKLGHDDNGINYLGIFKFLGSIGFIVWCYMFFCAYAFYKKKYKIILIIIPIFLLLGTNFLGPVTLFRYVYPLFIGLPLFIRIVLDEKSF